MTGISKESPGREFYTDLRMIREKRGLTPEDLFRATKLPVEFITLFEKNGLLRHPHYNLVYLKSFVKEYARNIGVNGEDAVSALEEAYEGRYRGSLAVAYLDVKPSDLPEIPEPAGAQDEVEIAKAESDDNPPDAPVEAGSTRSMSIPEFKLPDLPANLGKYAIWAAVVSACAIVLFLGIRSGVRFMQERQTIADEVMMSADSTSTEIAVPEPLLRDSMDITIVAEFGKLEPVRVRIDGSEELRYWVEEGDTLSLKAANDFTLGLYLDRLTLQVDGHSLPTDIRTAQNEVVYSREAILNFLRSQLESAVNR